MHEENFRGLDLGKKVDMVLREGQHLVTTDFYGAIVKLFHLKMNYVEVYHHPITGNVMRVSVARPQDLNKHLRNISVE